MEVPYKNSLINHCITRAKERYNLKLSPEDIGIIISLIQKNKAICLTFNFKKRNRRNIFKLNYNNTIIYPVYNENNQVIHTFLTKQMVDEDSLMTC